MNTPPAFLITIDTEGDNIWAHPETVTTQNARFIPRFQTLCEAYGFKPTYLVNYEMAVDPFFQQTGKEYLKKGTAEIGLHIHAWDSPPVDLRYGNRQEFSYLFELPDDLLYEKARLLTETLVRNFEIRPVSNRAGRWGFDSRVARVLVDLGYRVDCSVTPLVSWKNHKGLANGNGGSDYRRFPNRPYFMDLDDISKEGNSPLLEVPMTIRSAYNPIALQAYRKFEGSLAGKAIRKAFGSPVSWLRPNLRNLGRMLALVDQISGERAPYLEFMLHSSEFMPGGSPTFPNEESIERLFQHMDTLFRYIAGKGFQGMTMAEFGELHS